MSQIGKSRSVSVSASVSVSVRLSETGRKLKNSLPLCIALITLPLIIQAQPSFAEKTFTMRIQGEPETLDWNLAHTPIETPLMTNLMTGLVLLDSKLNLKPDLAESWKISRDGLTYTFKLRPGLKWSDGVPLRASHFVDSWERLLTPSLGAAYAYFLFDVQGAKEFNSGKTKDFSKVGVKALDDRTLEVKLAQPVSHWISIPSFWVTFPIREDLIAKYGSEWTRPGRMVTVGPYVLLAHQMDSKLVLGVNPHFYGSKPRLDKIEALIVTDDSTALNLYKTGKIDFLTDMPMAYLKELRTRPDFRVFPYLKTVYLGFAVESPSVSNAHLRKAIAMAINRSRLDDFFQGGQKPASSFVPPPLAAFSPRLGLPYDPVKAKAELKASGVDVSKMPPLQLLILNWEKSITLGQYIQEELKQNLGIPVVLEPFDNKTYRAQLNLHKHALFLTSWSADYPDADNFLSIFMSDSGNNRPGWKNAEFDKEVLKARYSTASAKRLRLYEALQKKVQEENAAILPLYYEPNIGLVNPRIHGLELNPLNYLDLRGISHGEKP